MALGLGGRSALVGSTVGRSRVFRSTLSGGADVGDYVPMPNNGGFSVVTSKSGCVPNHCAGHLLSQEPLSEEQRLTRGKRAITRNAPSANRRQCDVVSNVVLARLAVADVTVQVATVVVGTNAAPTRQVAIFIVDSGQAFAAVADISGHVATSAVWLHAEVVSN